MNRKLVGGVGREQGAGAGRLGERISRGAVLLDLRRIQPERRSEGSGEVQREAEERNRPSPGPDPAGRDKSYRERRRSPKNKRQAGAGRGRRRPACLTGVRCVLLSPGRAPESR